VPLPAKLLVGGIAADYADSLNGIAEKLPWVIAWIAISTARRALPTFWRASSKA
jgi:uncharacterized membrane protein YdfJ with MMPL/SSD domain